MIKCGGKVAALLCFLMFRRHRARASGSGQVVDQGPESSSLQIAQLFDHRPARLLVGSTWRDQSVLIAAVAVVALA